MILISRKPILIETQCEGHRVSYVAHPLWDQKLIDYIEQYNLQPGDDIGKHLKKTKHEQTHTRGTKDCD
jgi:hypothetical protein